MVQQTTQKLENGCYEICYENKTKMTVEKFKLREAREANGFIPKSMAKLEDEFWASMCSKEERYYGMENDVSLFNENCQHWILGKFTPMDSLIHTNDKHMLGITKPYLYVGGLFKAFGLHKEDCDLNSINYNHTGAMKIW